MKRYFRYNIETACNGMTIAHYLKRREYSRHIVVHLKKTKDGIRRNGTWARVNDVLHSGDLLEITITESGSSPDILPVALPLHIIYEDEDILVLDKAADMPVHPSQNNYDNTLANATAHYFEQKGVPFVFRCINRLDRGTTGLLVVAKHMLSSAILSGMMVRREIHREYLAIAEGVVPESGRIEASISRLPGSTIERCVDEQTGTYACTNYRRLCIRNNFSLVALKLETGRTHQIRVHMKHLGYPLAGDSLYNPSEKSGEHAVLRSLHRQALHSWRLSFHHPITKELLQFTAPLPPDMHELCPLPDAD